MDGFDIFHSSQQPYNVSDKDFCFPASKENLFQRRTSAERKEWSDRVFLILSIVFLIKIAVDWKGLALISILNLTAGVISVALLLKQTSIFLGSSSRSKSLRLPASRSPQSKNEVFSSRLVLLVALQELSIDQMNQDLYTLFCNTLVAAIVHIAFMEKVPLAKQEVGLRSLTKLAAMFLSTNSQTALAYLLFVASVVVCHVALLNILVRANKLIRDEYSKKDILVKWSDQMFGVLNSVPYPVVVFDKRSLLEPCYASPNDKYVPVIFFNFAADKFFGNTKESLVSFLELIDPQDEGTLIECLQELESGNEKKLAFTTEVPKDILSSSQKRKFDITLWKVNWLDKNVAVAMFNDDAYSAKNSNDRFSTRSKEALNLILKKTSDSVETLISNLRSFILNQIDQKNFLDYMRQGMSELICTKLFVDNYTINEHIEAPEVFNMRFLIMNIVDWTSKDFKSKEISISLMFSRDFPFLVTAKLSTFRTFFFDLLKYLSKRMNNGKLDLYFDIEKSDDFVEEDVDQVTLKFSVTLQALRDVDLPPKNFLVWAPSQTRTLLQSQDEGDAQLMNWLSALRDNLGMRVTSEDLPNSDITR